MMIDNSCFFGAPIFLMYMENQGTELLKVPAANCMAWFEKSQLPIVLKFVEWIGCSGIEILGRRSDVQNEWAYSYKTILGWISQLEFFEAMSIFMVMVFKFLIEKLCILFSYLIHLLDCSIYLGFYSFLYEMKFLKNPYCWQKAHCDSLRAGDLLLWLNVAVAHGDNFCNGVLHNGIILAFF